MRFRKLRIAWSLGWGVMAVLLIVLWVRSYWWYDSFAYFPTSRSYGVGSIQGELVFAATNFGPGLSSIKLGPQPQWSAHSEYITPTTGFPLMRDGRPVPRTMGFGWFPAVNWLYVFVPHSFPIVIVVAIVPAPWAPWQNRFSLRTLLIATTLVAVVLGLIVGLR
jgi:hypothetical protein